jgi:hypothetical protein
MKQDHRREDYSIAGSLFAMLLVISGATYAQTGGATAPGAAGTVRHITDLRGEWGRNGPSFFCKVGTRQKLAPEAINPDMLARACQRMGPFVIGDDAQVLQTTLGPPHKTLPQPNGATSSVYFLQTQGQYPYLVATVSKNRIIALQVTGRVAAAKGYGFNGVDPGTSADALVRIFGQPFKTQPSEEQGTDLWSYGVWPFSFEVRDGLVSSIRISEP